jgi:hypothetical protein
MAMTQSARKNFRDPENKDGLVSRSTSENGATTGMAHKEARPPDPVELDIADPHFMTDAYDTYADLRAKGPVSRVRFAGGEEEVSGDGDEVIATLLDHRFSVDPRRAW